VNYARRQQYVRLSRAGTAATASAGTVLLALAVAGAGAVSAAGAVLALALGLGVYARHWLALAERSRVGARSEDDVRRALVPLRAEGWRLRHSVPWRGRGDIDSLAIAPTGTAVAIEAKTRTYDERHLGRVREQAVWLWRRRRRWCRSGVLPVLCVVRARGVQRWEQGVLVISLDRLVSTLRLSRSTPNGWAAHRLGGVAKLARKLGECPDHEEAGQRFTQARGRVGGILV
jgi:hypothetical protein